MAQTYDPNVKVKDGNIVLYTCHFKDYPRQWVAADGSTVQKITFESGKTLAVSIYSANCFNPPISGNEQNLDVRVAVFGSREEKVTIPTDAEKTNGYVTFTQAAGDDASFRQLKVVVDANAVPATEATELSTYVNTTGAAQSGMGIDLDLSSHEDLVGKTVTPLDVKYCTIAGTGTTPPTEDVLKAGLADIWNDTVANASVKIYPDKSIINNYLMCPATNVRQAYIDQMGAPADKPFFVKFVNGSYDSWLTDYTFGASDSIVPAKNRVMNNNSRGWAIQVKLDDAVPGWNANFKLNLNQFKSQCGDINAQTDPDFNTAKVEGTYADGTEFSYDFCIK